jgi:hypothetical protein
VSVDEPLREATNITKGQEHASGEPLPRGPAEKLAAVNETNKDSAVVRQAQPLSTYSNGRRDLQIQKGSSSSDRRVTQPTRAEGSYASSEERLPSGSSNFAAIVELKDRLIGLNARADAVRRELGTLQQQLQGEGVDLRQEIAESRNRMDGMLKEADLSLKAGDAERAKLYLDRVEKEIRYLGGLWGR